MKLQATGEGDLLIEEIPPFLLHLIREIPLRADSKNPRVEARFFPDPSSEETLVEDWKSLVQPGLLSLFQADRETVRADLRGVTEAGGLFVLRISKGHADAWLGALNQARLSIAEEWEFGESDIAGEAAPDPADPRAMALFQLGFYGFLQECLVRMQD